MEEIKYQKAGKDDIDLLIDLRFQFQKELSGEVPEEIGSVLYKSLKQYFEESISDGSYICYIAKSEDKVVGVGGAAFRQQPGSVRNPSGKMVYIMNMFTAPDFRRKGISTKILNLLMEDAKQKGISMFELHATKEGEPVYIKNGFQLHTEPTYRKFEK